VYFWVYFAVVLFGIYLGAAFVSK
jgi:hypothetical protein